MIYRVFIILLTGIATSFFLFPFSLQGVGIPLNTKMILALLGLALFVYDRFKGKMPTISHDFLILSLVCMIISVWAYAMTVFNNTRDYTFATYIISVWVWLSAAYFVVQLIRFVHSTVNVELIGNYLIAVCVGQCIIAYAMTFWPGLESFVDIFMSDSSGSLGRMEGRMHGLGASLDPTGLRFAGVLVILSYLGAKYGGDSVKGAMYLVAFILITVIGNMISRSATIGLILALPLFVFLKWPKGGNIKLSRSWGISGGILLVTALTAVWLYNNNLPFRENLRFGFEGFFSLFEKGRWEVRSSQILRGMIVWPETLKTWIVGDGFFNNTPDPDRFGRVRGGFYMMTDIGYLRYIFYFGLIGLLGMIAVLVQITMTCVRKLGDYKPLFLMLLLVTLVGWVKVSSDIIMVFAPFLILAYQTETSEIGVSPNNASSTIRRA